LNKLNKLLISTLKQTESDESTKDGMDIALVIIDKSKNELHFAGAHNSMYLVNGNNLTEYPADSRPIGISRVDVNKSFTNHIIPYSEGNVWYVASDGYADQTGGANKKKFYYQPFRDLLLEVSILPMEKQHEKIKSTMENWKQGSEQLDDMLVIGVRL